MEITNNHILLAFLCLLIVFGWCYYEINDFMPKYHTCDDDFQVIEECKCLPWENSTLYPKLIKGTNTTRLK